MNKLFKNPSIHYQLPVNELVRQTLKTGGGELNDTGALVINTGEFTGRSPLDKFIVKDELTEHTVDWNKFNQPITAARFLRLKEDVVNYLDGRQSIWIRDAFACADDDYRLKLRIINESPSCNHFAANMFIAPGEEDLKDFSPDWTIIQAPGFKASPVIHGTRQSNFTVVCFTDKVILIGGSGYTGEIKKGVFTILNYILPLGHGVLSMHCSANEGLNGDTALFFGLSGTGKTTLSSDPARMLIGDDEHGWSDNGVFNVEGGCYAKIINLSKEHEPDIFNAVREGALVENTCFIPGTKEIDYGCDAITENTRVSYPLSFIPKIKIPSKSRVPENIFFLTCDAHGVFPPVSKLTDEQAMFYFINGYTAKIAGTEEGVKEPQITFSACFGAPFLPLHSEVYADLLKEKLKNKHTNVWLVNTGWTGGAYGIGKRISINYSRAIVTAALDGSLMQVPCLNHPIFDIAIPQFCPGVPNDVLIPWKSWNCRAVYDETAYQLLERFKSNSNRQPVNK